MRVPCIQQVLNEKRCLVCRVNTFPEHTAHDIGISSPKSLWFNLDEFLVKGNISVVRGERRRAPDLSTDWFDHLWDSFNEAQEAGLSFELSFDVLLSYSPIFLSHEFPASSYLGRKQLWKMDLVGSLIKLGSVSQLSLSCSERKS